jgi:glycerophosphoryl diester phosphodiesterase
MNKGIKLVLSSLIFMIFTQNGIAQQQKIDLEGHRGSRGLMPENTIPAMLEALKWGVTTLEMDVVITKDGQVILSHEPYMNLEIAIPPTNVDKQLTSKDFNIYKMTYEEVVKWDIGTKFNPKFPDQQKIKLHKPLLKDVIQEVESYVKKNGLHPVSYNIETKMSVETDHIYHPGPEEFVALLSKVIIDGGIAERTIVQSFDPRSLIALHKMNTPFQLSYLIESTQKLTFDEVINLLGFKPTIISPAYQMVDQNFVNHFHQHEIKVIVWTVNLEADIKKMARLGVDGIISDYPNRFSILKQN